VAVHRAVDRLRREAAREDRHAQAALLHARGEPAEEGAVRDDRLRLIFTCCHPALATGAQVALTLRLLGGLTSPVVALNRAVAVAEVDGPDAALTLVDGLDLDGYHLFHAIRADLLRRLDRNAEAAQAYETAITHTEHATERDFLQRRRQRRTRA
jgi:predicted RNA polymerase sigma factor